MGYGIPSKFPRQGEFLVRIEQPGPPANAGFTLIEVLVAMLILSIGLLGLEALGIGAARSVAFADRQSEYARVASTYLEGGLEPLRRTTPALPPPCVLVVPQGTSGLMVSRTVDYQATDPSVTVTVTVQPTANTAVQAPPFTLSSKVYMPATPLPAVSSCV